jgi:23S rRNA (pseudouridine1915-N3)-methyltransferase
LRLLVFAVGTRMPAWVDAAWSDFAKRMPREMPLVLVEVKVEPRNSGKTAEALLAAEANRLRLTMPIGCRRVILDEHGEDLNTRQLAQRLEKWLGEGSDVAIFIGGPDGLDSSFKAEARESLRLSSLTLPHAMVRVILAEALYRASSLLRGHPYHRE